MSREQSVLEEVVEGLGKLTVDRKVSDSRQDNWWNESTMAMTPDQIRVMMEVAISTALRTQKTAFEKQLEEVNQRFNQVVLTTPQVEPYQEIEIVAGRQCDEPLDIVKSLPDFEGKQETYVSWRQAAHTAYKIFENFDGSSKHYQAVAIIRNKIKGPADMILSSFNTVLNFKAIIDRLDFTYSDKRPIYLIEQELSILRQGNMTLLQFYDEVEKKLTLLTNKTIMTYDRSTAASINEKYRMDALRVFISGTKKGLSDVLFSARPNDLPSALALAQEVESNHERYIFATNYAKSLEEKRQNRNNFSGGQAVKNPHFSKRQGYRNNSPQREDPVQPMDVDDSVRFRQSTKFRAGNSRPSHLPYHDNEVRGQHAEPSRAQYFNNEASGQALKRQHNGSARFTGPKQQRINFVSQETDEQDPNEYQEKAESVASEIDDEEDFDQINFLDKTLCYRS